MHAVFPDKGQAQVADDAGKQGAAGNPQQHTFDPPRFRQAGHQHINPHMDAGTYTVGCAKFGHPDKHIDTEFLGPAQIEAQQPVLQAGDRQTGGVAVQHRKKDDDGCRSDQEGNDDLFQAVQVFHHGNIS